LVVEVVVMTAVRRSDRVVRSGAAEVAPRPSLHVVRARGPRRPAWMALYLALLLIMAGGGVGTGWARTDGERQLVGGLMCLAFLGAAAAWTRCNRVALHRLGEPATGPGRLWVRIVRSRRPIDPAREPDGRIVRLAPGQPMPWRAASPAVLDGRARDGDATARMAGR
jgi:hypothetical protein